jgi:site-specific recombinase XerD
MKQAAIRAIDPKTDKWVIESFSSLGDRISFDFTFLPNQWFKKTLKEITIECMTIKKPSLETLYRYNSGLRRFFEFLTEYGIQLKTFAGLTHQYAQMFLFYLQQQHLANSTKNVAMCSLKWMVNHGRSFDYEGFPEQEIFDGEEYQALKTEDALKTRYIPDDVMQQIEAALHVEKNLLLKSLIEIGIDTGIRLSEALELSEGCLTEDFTGKPVLYVYSSKSKTERFIPVSNRVKRAVEKLKELSEEGRKAIGSKNLTVYWLKGARPPRYDRVIQSVFRPLLYSFVKRHDIRDSEGNLYPLTYHAFRHTLGTEMLNKGMSIFEIQDYLGHESLHSTAGYVKIKNPKVQKEYKRLGFIGMIVDELSEKALGKGSKLDSKTLKAAALPDGMCKKPINNEGKLCAKFNMCIICPKFVTTPTHLPVHKNHLERLKADKEAYMATEYIGNQEHLETIEYALETIIARLEALQHG